MHSKSCQRRRHKRDQMTNMLTISKFALSFNRIIQIGDPKDTSEIRNPIRRQRQSKQVGLAGPARRASEMGWNGKENID